MYPCLSPGGTHNGTCFSQPQGPEEKEIARLTSSD